MSSFQRVSRKLTGASAPAKAPPAVTREGAPPDGSVINTGLGSGAEVWRATEPSCGPDATLSSRTVPKSSIPSSAFSAGVRASARSGARMVSCGMSELDRALGGGLVLGSVTLILEDAPTTYFEYILTHFLAQGGVHGHATLVAHGEGTEFGYEFVQQLPSLRSKMNFPRSQQSDSLRDGDEKDTHASEQRALRIAWRYARLAQESAGSRASASSVPDAVAPFCGEFDLEPGFSGSSGLEPMTRIRVIDLDQSAAGQDLNQLQQCVALIESELDALDSSAACATRVVIRSVDLLLHGGHGSKPSSRACCASSYDASRTLCWAVARLHALARRSGAAVMLSMAGSVEATASLRVQHICDNVIQVDSVGGHGTSQLGLGDFLAALRVLKTAPHPRTLKMSLQHDGGGASASVASVLVLERSRRRVHLYPASAAPDVDVDSFDKPKKVASVACAPGPSGTSAASDW
ncbi:Elongator complex protein 4 [Porphyridium purpureum]|uniref:Elongator complex protein 4 n=1 Tax=Porphyridium purpureum TaxID=35688 RepID=A0A5J4ZAC1_PORPP|nr:Elongator complex protein 4 [Porphyridium purpureum]|eukprot:POR8228..scf295_1